MAEGETNMKFIPILFSTPMVEAILDDRKIMTRRVIKSRTGMFQVAKANYEPNASFFYHDTEVFELDENESQGKHIFCPYGNIGDVLWVRETFRIHDDEFVYKAGVLSWKNLINLPWKPSLFMPKAACRIFLQVTDVRVKRLNDITEEDAIKEGMELFQFKASHGFPTMTFKGLFQNIWGVINGPSSWEENPWVWVISFKRIEKPENFI